MSTILTTIDIPVSTELKDYWFGENCEKPGNIWLYGSWFPTWIPPDVFATPKKYCKNPSTRLYSNQQEERKFDFYHGSMSYEQYVRGVYDPDDFSARLLIPPLLKHLLEIKGVFPVVKYHCNTFDYYTYYTISIDDRGGMYNASDKLSPYFSVKLMTLLGQVHRNLVRAEKSMKEQAEIVLSEQMAKEKAQKEKATTWIYDKGDDYKIKQRNVWLKRYGFEDEEEFWKSDQIVAPTPKQHKWKI